MPETLVLCPQNERLNGAGESIDRVVAHSRLIIRRGSKSFAQAARLFDADTRASVYMLYAWCRHCDDAIDGQEAGFARTDCSPIPVAVRLAQIREHTLAALAGRAEQTVYQALAHVVMKHRIPHRHPLELLDGFAMDASGRTYSSADDTLDYCYHVAGVVGVMMAMIMGVRDGSALNRACDLGIAFQLTNIARDAIPDAEAGRLYLPGQWLDEAGVRPLKVTASENRGRILAVVERLLDLADDYYASAQCGLSALPLRAAWAVATALSIYREIGQEVRRRGVEAWDERISISKRRRLTGMAQGGLAALMTRSPRGVLSAPERGGLWTRPDLGR
jgi:phytoene synthase